MRPETERGGVGDLGGAQATNEEGRVREGRERECERGREDKAGCGYGMVERRAAFSHEVQPAGAKARQGATGRP